MVAEDEPVSTAPYHVDTFHELLSTLASALDVRDVFRRLSAVAARIVPHDEANLKTARSFICLPARDTVNPNSSVPAGTSSCAIH
jgi:hypothetical protein